MKLPISLLLLAAVSRALSKLTTEKSHVSGQTTKRELLEGNFGQRVLNKYEPPNTTPGIQYADNLKHELHEKSTAEQIFGSRIFPITKISDLLTGQGPRFDIALANHLYAPVSVYNAKKVGALDELPASNPAKIAFQHLNQEKPKSEYITQYLDEDIRPKKILSRKPNFHLPGLLGPEFYTQTSKYPQELFRPKHFTATPEPQLYVYKEQFNFGPFIPVAYNQQQPPVKIKPEDLGFDYENQESSQEDKEHGLHKVATTYRPEQQNRPLTGTQAYYAHPDGAISYTRFIHDQAILDAQPDSQILYNVPSKTNQQTFEPEFKEEENINVPEPPPSEPRGNLAPQQQYVPVSQQQFSQPFNQRAPFQRGFHFEKLSGTQFAYDQRPQHPQFYLHPIKNQFSQLQPSIALQSLENQQPSVEPLRIIAAEVESLGQSTNNTASRDESVPGPNQLLESTQTRFTAQPSTQDSFPVLRHYTSIPATVAYHQSVATLSTAPATIQPQVQITPKALLSLDQVLQPTTIQPDTINDTPRDLKAESKYVSQDSVSLETPQPTLQSLLASPVTLQSLSSPQPAEHYLPSTPRTEILTRAQQSHDQASSHHQIQIQQQHLQEIHSELASESRDNSQQHLKEISQEKHQSLQTTPQHQYTTTQATESSKPDYEIEIASHIDHNQLPKDLQPVTTAQETNDVVENHGQQGQQFYSQNQTHVLERRPNTEPIQSFGEPPSYQNINFHDPNSLFLGQSLAPIQPFIQPRVFSNVQEFVLHPHFQQAPTFPPVQYFGKYAQSIFGGV